jgi:hypothetical protein
VKNDLQKAKTDVKTLVETVKILKEDQDQLSVRLNNMHALKMADSAGCLGDTLNSTTERREILENECQGCVRLKLEVNSVTLELESATEIIKILKKELESVVMEGRKTKSDLCCDEGEQSQIQKNYNGEITDKLNDNNVILTRVGNSNQVLTRPKEAVKPTERQFPSTTHFIDSNKNKGNSALTRRKTEIVVNQIPVVVNGRSEANNGEDTISSTGLVCNNSITNSCENIIPSIRPVSNGIRKINNKLREAGKHNIVIIGDSHCRGSAIMIRDYVGSKFEVSGITKPGAGTAEIVGQTSMNYRCLTKKDLIVLHGGANDVYRNNSKRALLQIKKFCEEINTNIIILDIPQI